jgi:ABC-type transport system involved in cytochrome bd biosynthesis fused ATPase/permease subunit
VLPASLREVLGNVPDAEILSALEAVGLAEKVDNLPDRIGYQLERADDERWNPVALQRLFLAGCLTTKASLIVLDEATATLNSSEAVSILRLIMQRLSLNQNLIVISHHEEVSKLMNKRILLGGDECLL